MTLAAHVVKFFNPSVAAFAIVVACDCVFIAYFTVRRRSSGATRRRARLSMIGIVLQGIAWGFIGNLYRMPIGPLFRMPRVVEVGLAVLAAAMAVGSVWLCIAAVVTLGRQWTYVAEVADDHQLVMRGPYARLRHPIYAGMTGLAIASALAIDRWWAVPIVLALHLAGTWIRVREEDRLLRLTHGASFEAYAAKVPALIPRLFGSVSAG